MTSTRAWTRVVAAIATTFGVLTAGAIGAGAAQASGAQTPTDVIAALSVAAIDDLRDQADGMPELADAASFGDVHRVHRWSHELIAGDASDPVTATDEWVAPVLSSAGEAVAIYRVWRETPDGTAEFAGVDGDAATAVALAEVDPSVTLISDPTIAAWYTLQGGVVTPVGSARFDDIRAATPIDQVAETVSARYAKNIRDAAPATGNSSAGWVWAGAGGLVIAMIAVGVGVRRRVSLG
ncbi:hypothetical protein E1I21_13760 [Microbacterium oleivorans]|uniref:hypothetical protein n=1 Tax=Microbacterium oleivorans TaxID=273677 RepID=UPI0010A2D78D|nr:hypothetical protein [Microbacterium oleivorans]THE06093.1 hypothetical protein E1I21_13760 [Microbacterium oleivorans]